MKPYAAMQRDRAEEQQELRARARARCRPAIGESTIITRPDGITMRLAASSDSPKPAPVATGSSSICGYTTFDANSENPIATEAMFVSSTGGPRGDAQVEQRLGDAQLEPAPQQQHDEPAEAEREHGGRRPAPLVAARDREQDADQPDREAGRADEVEAPGGAQHAHRHDPQHEREARRRRGRRPPRTARASRCARSRAALIGSPSAPPTPSVALMRAIARVDAVLVQHVAQDRDAERHDADDRALQRAADDDADDARRQRGDDRADDHHGEQHQHDPPLAVHVAEAARRSA